MTHPGRDIVVVGASAGGVEALRRLISSLPAAFKASVFIVLHTRPDTKSYLVDILARSCRLPVTNPENGERIEKGRIYVAPADLHMLVEGDHITLVRGPTENRTRPAINPLFRSAAASYGSRVVGVILTGTLDDGTAGLWAVKQCGGIAVVQDPADAAFDEMPKNALQEVKVDYCVPLAEIPNVLLSLTEEPFVSESEKPIPSVIRLSNDAAKMKIIGMEVDKFGERSALTCPECNGALWQFNEAGLLEYRCHVGHAYSAEHLKIAQNRAVEQALWSAFRALNESAGFDERLAERAKEQRLEVAEAVHLRNADEKKHQAEQVRGFLMAMRPAGYDSNNASIPSER